MLNQGEKYISEHSRRAREMEGTHFEANQPKKPRNTHLTNQRLSNGFKGPQTRETHLNLPPTTMYGNRGGNEINGLDP